MPAATSNPPPATLARPVCSLWSVGPERVVQLARLGIHTIEELLLHRPRRYEDRRHVRTIAELQMGEAATVRGPIVAAGLNRFRKGAKSVFEIIVDDGTARLHCRWWNLPFMQNYFEVGDEVFVFGKPVSLKPRTIDHPETEVIEAGEGSSIHINRVAPVYPLTEGLQQRWLRSLIWRTLENHERHIAEPLEGKLQVAGSRFRSNGPLTPSLSPSEGQRVPKAGAGAVQGTKARFVSGNALPTRAHSIRMLHFPEQIEDTEAARCRLALDEFIELQWAVQTRRLNLQTKARALPCAGDNRFIRPYLKSLGFELTAAQTRVLREVRRDLGAAQPMRRLLQGDVGSGKTAVAACSALMALESGFNVALMAPTEILAEQHFRNFGKWFEPLGVQVELRTGSVKTGEGRGSKVEGQQPLALSTLDPRPSTLFIGTHALLTAGFEIANLGLVIIDEQHKFGVAQREQLVRKGRYPHLLVMTATPIPRTLGLTLYGDLDISVIDELPGGRGTVKTFVRAAGRLPKVWEFMRGKLAEGRQVYVIYPRVEEADLRTGAKAVKTEVERLRKELAPYRVDAVHGRLKPREKEQVMSAFRRNEVNVLLATSVVEVGVDVPNATVMLIENAEQFGLAQLHQLRGRIGRGAHDAWCILVASAKTDEARQRLRVLEGTNDGFQIAEADLRLRGPGELLGREQSGLPPFRFGNLATDRELVEHARELVSESLARGKTRKE